MGKINFKIGKMKPSDAKEVSELGVKTKELQIDDRFDQYYSEKNIKDLVKDKDQILLTVKVEDKLIGFGIVTYHKYFKEIYLSDIVIEEKYRGLGVGKLLYKELINLSKKRGPNWAWGLVHENNLKMQKFLEKEGFIKGRKFYFYYTDKI